MICIIDGCNNKAIGSKCGLCNKHYLQKKRGCRPRSEDLVPLNAFEDYTELMAYSLGLLYSDGFILKAYQEGRQRQLGLKMNDEDAVRFVAEYLNVQDRVKYNKRKNGTKSEFWEFRISSDRLVSKVEKLGLTMTKSFNQLVPKIPQSLMRHFIRGLIDGDGSLSNDTHQVSIIAFGDLAWYLHYFLRNLGFENTINLNKQCAKINLYGIKVYASCDNSLNFLNYLYKDSNYYMNRKYQQYLFIKNNPKQIYNTKIRGRIQECSDIYNPLVDDDIV